ncbi:DUF6880 family protein [Cupriavidus consociatus]|uniref:DUF6880 family protein n=1 Tax=Cupriavidus consociatus TaxID=2821357 RepID=UPI001AE36901|nr:MULTISPECIES: DUF6880 family protein [unclassified Cupriavidus]MBP0621002.1 hypothetical protein [Cupriavidus sp. LEh25]MDK2657671.1 hypothetical protein [Cupriavidus sp. LEh21]
MGLIALAETVYERTTEEGWEISVIFDEACSNLVKLSNHAGVEPAVFATKVVAALNANQYGEYRALMQAIALAEMWAPAPTSRNSRRCPRACSESSLMLCLY